MKLLFVSNAIFCSFSCIKAHSCVHASDRIRPNSTIASIQSYSNHPFDLISSGSKKQERKLRKLPETDEYYKPIRIHAHYMDNHLDLNVEQLAFLKNDLIPKTIEKWQANLKVVPVKSALFAQPACSRVFSTTVPTCAAVVENQMCLEAVIPKEHFQPIRVCKTCPGTADNGCNGGNCTMTNGNGVADTDFTIYVQAVQTEQCGEHVLAYAATCQRDQHDRPTFGMVNFCPNKISANGDHEKIYHTALHEFSHALGFSSDLFAYMREADGTPRTARNEINEPERLQTQTCPNGVVSSNFAMPSTNTVKFFEERGHSVAKLVTPNVMHYVQNHFGCDTLNGAELEDQEGSCIGSHWEERIFEQEFMSPVQSYSNVMSGLTLAFFEDSGWYRTNLSQGEQLQWGRKRGCDFAMASCIDSTSNVPSDDDHFCTSDENLGCTIDRTSKAVCSLKPDVGQSIPEIYRYFSNSRQGGATFPDFCPIWQGYTTGSCADPSNLFKISGTNLNILGETYSSTAMCALSTLHHKEGANWKLSKTGSGCYDMTCSVDSGIITILLPNGKSDPVKVECDQKGQAIQVEGYDGHLICPDPKVICGNGTCAEKCGKNSLCIAGTCSCQSGYQKNEDTQECKPVCPNGCSNHGRCDIESKTCSCNPSFTGEDCSFPVKKTNTPSPGLRTNLFDNNASSKLMFSLQEKLVSPLISFLVSITLIGNYII